MKPIPLDSGHPDEAKPPIAPNLYCSMSYSLFFRLKLSGGLKPPISSCYFQAKRRNKEGDAELLDGGWPV